MHLINKRRRTAAIRTKMDLTSQIESEYEASKPIERDVIANLNWLLRQEEGGTSTARKPFDGHTKDVQSSHWRLEPVCDDGATLKTVNGDRKKNKNCEGKNEIASDADHHQLVSPSDRESIKTYPYRIAEQLRICKTTVKSENENVKAICGFECLHCAGKDFREFPETYDDVRYEIPNFEEHLLHECDRVPSGLRSHLSWMEQNGFHSTTRSLAKLILQRLQVTEEEENDAMKKAQEDMNKAQERILSRKRKQSHSVLENVQSLNSSLR